MSWEDLPKHVNELATALVALTVALGGLLTMLIAKAREAKRAWREAASHEATSRIATEAAVAHRETLEGAVESVDAAVDALPSLELPESAELAKVAPETRRLILAEAQRALRAKLKATQTELGVQSDVQQVVEAVRRKGETPETGVKVPPPAPLG